MSIEFQAKEQGIDQLKKLVYDYASLELQIREKNEIYDKIVRHVTTDIIIPYYKKLGFIQGRRYKEGISKGARLWPGPSKGSFEGADLFSC